MSPTAPPPQLPPQVSPDGKWVWDGRQWQPLAVGSWEPAAAALIPQSAMAPAPPVVAAPVYVAPQDAFRPSPEYSFPVAAPSTPLWQEPARGPKTYIYVVGGIVVLIMVMMVLNSLSVVPFHWFESAAPPTARPATSPLPPTTSRTDSARADRFLTLALRPAMDGVTQTVSGLQVCNGTLSVSCLSALKATDQQLKKLLLVIDRGDFPLCIAAGMSKMRGDFGEMDTALLFAIKGFQLNRSSDLNAGMKRFAVVAGPIQGDANAVNLAQKTQCTTQEVGP